MWPLIIGIFRRYAPIVTFPFAAVIGFAGYHVEGWLSDRHTPSTAPILHQRQERLLQGLDSDSAKRKKHNPLEVNLSPSLSS